MRHEAMEGRQRGMGLSLVAPGGDSRLSTGDEEGKPHALLVRVKTVFFSKDAT